jgi:hypothetical protein
MLSNTNSHLTTSANGATINCALQTFMVNSTSLQPLTPLRLHQSSYVSTSSSSSNNTNKNNKQQQQQQPGLNPSPPSLGDITIQQQQASLGSNTVIVTDHLRPTCTNCDHKVYAVSHCNDCDASFCNQCNKAHGRLKPFKNHKINVIVYTPKNTAIRKVLEEVWEAKKNFTQEEIQNLSERPNFRDKEISVQKIKTFINNKKEVISRALTLLGPVESTKKRHETNSECQNTTKSWRTTFSQQEILDKEFKKNNYPSRTQMQPIVDKLNKEYENENVVTIEKLINKFKNLRRATKVKNGDINEDKSKIWAGSKWYDLCKAYKHIGCTSYASPKGDGYCKIHSKETTKASDPLIDKKGKYIMLNGVRVIYTISI